VRQLDPVEILVPCRNDGSSEHEAAFRLVSAALASLPIAPRILEYPVWSWWSPSLAWRLLFTHTRVHRCRFSRHLARKRAALAVYRSQTRPLAPQTHSALPDGFVALFSAPEEYFFEN
jgi:LmbE family N-acetylglucosaminyl deacetylase